MNTGKCYTVHPPCEKSMAGEFYILVDTQHTIQQKDATCKYGEFSIKDTELAPLSPLHDAMNFASVDVDV